MRLFKRKLREGDYYGPVVFVDGKHYPSPNGHADLRQHVLWNAEEGVYKWAKPEDPTHQHLYERNVVELLPHQEGE